MQKSTYDLMEKIGIRELFVVPHGKLQGSTVLATNGKDDLTVSQMLKSAEYLIKFNFLKVRANSVKQWKRG